MHRRWAVAETWGPCCDGFLAASDPDRELLSRTSCMKDQSIAHVVTRCTPCGVTSTTTIGTITITGGDDHHVIVQKLAPYGSTLILEGAWNDDSEPLYLWEDRSRYEKRRYCNGGSGYTLNRVALKMLVRFVSDSSLLAALAGFDEDKIVASCFVRLVYSGRRMMIGMRRDTTLGMLINIRIGLLGNRRRTGRTFPHNHMGLHGKKGLGQISETSVCFISRRNDPTIDSGMRTVPRHPLRMCRNMTTKRIAAVGTTDEIEHLADSTVIKHDIRCLRQPAAVGDSR
jgi:hypothetical protein